MTTIAASLREMAMCADSATVAGDVWWPCTKIVRVGESLVGCSGDSSSGIKFIEWMRDGGKRPKVSSDFCALVLGEGRLDYYYGTLIPDPIERQFHAIGSGASAALGAIKHGADITTAVRIACEIDPGSREPILYERLHNADPKTV